MLTVARDSAWTRGHLPSFKAMSERVERPDSKSQIGRAFIKIKRDNFPLYRQMVTVSSALKKVNYDLVGDGDKVQDAYSDVFKQFAAISQVVNIEIEKLKQREKREEMEQKAEKAMEDANRKAAALECYDEIMHELANLSELHNTPIEKLLVELGSKIELL